ncbi:MAG: helix-turn-helix domain-containing protein [Oceanicaulis sp.]|nr:helix-turn-helix domain-containing protein [Oceanicaulis sp.]
MAKSMSNIKGNLNGISSVKPKLYVKYMVCLRDKIALRSELDRLGYEYEFSVHGGIDFQEGITEEEFKSIRKSFIKCGLILLNEQESMVIDRIINTVIEVVHYSEKLPKISFTDILSKQLSLSDESVLKIFSDVKGVSILQFIILQKVERVKELLLYEKMSLAEIADTLNYKNQHLMVAQFKKVTGLAPSYFSDLKVYRDKLSTEKC